MPLPGGGQIHDRSNMLQKPYQQKICLFYILILLLWGTVSSSASASEMTGMFCGEE